MNPVDKNNEPLDAVLRRAMRAQPGDATPDCADAQSLAAYSDRSMTAAERERLETHFADCMRCQVLLADIARADDSARLARSASAVSWYRKWRVAMPALAAVAAIVVFIAIRRRPNEGLPKDQLVAMAKQEAPVADLDASAPAPVPAAVAAAPAMQSAPPSNLIASNEAKSQASAGAKMMNENVAGALSRRVGAPGAIAQGAARSFAAADSVTGAGVGGFIAQAGVLATVSPADRSVTWIVGKNGAIRRQDARGGTHIQQSGVSADLVAGAAPSASVCWVVGNNGTVVRTTDGEHWTTVASPTSENLVAASADSANDVIITTAGGKNFASTDGGVTWRQQ